MRLPLISRRNQMNTAQPIRNLEDLKNFKNYYFYMLVNVIFTYRSVIVTLFTHKIVYLKL